MRYRVGFENTSLKSSITERAPGFVPIVDTHSRFAFGVVIALADDQSTAERIVALLNAAEPIVTT
jgi:hypothetical protein